MTGFVIDKTENGFFISNGKIVYSYSEHDGIEVLVSLLRSFYEYRILYKDDYNMKTRNIMYKPDYGFNVSIYGNKLNVFINDTCLFKYELLEISDAENYIYNFLNHEYGMNCIDFRWFDPFYLEHMLGVDLPYITGIEIFNEKIENLFFYNRVNPKKVRIYEHQVFINLKNGISSGLEAERINQILTEMSKHTLLNERFYGVVYNDEKVIRDGTHRIACLYHLYGNIDIPIIRIKTSKEYYSYSMYKAAVNNQYKEVIK